MKNWIIFLSAALFFGNSLFAQISKKGLIGYYSFDEEILDESGNCHTPAGGFYGKNFDRFGKEDAAIELYGLESLDISYPDFYSSSYSYSIWANMDQLPPLNSQYMILAGGTILEDQFINLVNKVGQYNGVNAGSYIVPGSQLTLNQDMDLIANKWYHIVVTRNFFNYAMYVDGILIKSIVSNPPSNPTYGIYPSFKIGSRGNNSLAFKGKLDDIRIYNRAILFDEVKELYNEGLCLNPIAVTDTLFINLNVSTFNPLTFNSSLKIYPNPTATQVTLDFSDFSEITGYSLKIVDGAAKIVYDKLLTKKIETIDLSSWSGKGIYFVTVTDAKGNLIDTKKIILQ